MFQLDNLGIIIEAPSGPYPYGRLINSSPPGSGNGSPAVAEWSNDPLMGMYASLSHFGLTPSDLQEQVGDSDLVRLLQANFPVGSFIFFGADTDPSTLDIRALACDGSTVSEATYADLFAIVGTLWNTGGEPGGQFRLPDFRGKFPRGYDAGAGVDVGRVFGVAQLDAMQGHWHEGYGQTDAVNTPGENNRNIIGIPAALQANMVQNPITDGVNGVPRTATETRSVNETAYIYIRY